MKKVLLLLFTCVALSSFAQTDTWASFAKTKFEAKYSEKAAIF